ncbi:hypothetical protein BC936DRAFT_143456 [Jimgerdemannia flammicorona]|uniref:Arb2 domain-containing protein n=1 Tax=Jimgerdemannia flammicorona TaxID=994334 RepID=A0A433DDT1_9FUNG|nr:hypothetical protein BC936DRAFT_143456 [Jimgerdemannia flammicorona]
MYRKKPKKVEKPVFPETLEGFGYKINEEGKLRRIEDDVIGSIVEDMMQAEPYDLVRHLIPINANPADGDMHSAVANALETTDKLLLLIPPSNIRRSHHLSSYSPVFAMDSVGQWTRRVMIDDSIYSGSMLDTIKRAREEGFEVFVFNPNENFWCKGRGWTATRVMTLRRNGDLGGGCLMYRHELSPSHQFRFKLAQLTKIKALDISSMEVRPQRPIAAMSSNTLSIYFLVLLTVCYPFAALAFPLNRHAKANNIAVIASAWGAHCLMDLMNNNCAYLICSGPLAIASILVCAVVSVGIEFEFFRRQVRAVALANSVHSRDTIVGDGKLVWLHENVVNWIVSDANFGDMVEDLRFGCNSVSAAVELTDHIIPKAMDPIFKFFRLKITGGDDELDNISDNEDRDLTQEEEAELAAHLENLYVGPAFGAER